MVHHLFPSIDVTLPVLLSLQAYARILSPWNCCPPLYLFFTCSAKQFREALSKKHDMDCGLAMIIKQRAKVRTCLPYI
jgi:hypothetical protein